MTWYAAINLPSPEAHASCLALATLTPRLACDQQAGSTRIILDLGSGTTSAVRRVAERAARLVAAPTPPAIGVAHTQLLATLAAQPCAPGQVRVLTPADEAAFLAPLLITVVPIPPAITARLHRLGLDTLGQVAALPRDALQAQFGQPGCDLFALVRGHDLRPFIPDAAPPSLALRRWFAGAITDRTVVQRALARLAAHLCQRLDAGGWSAGALTLTIESDDAAPSVIVRSLAQPTVQARLVQQHCTAMLDQATITSGVTALVLAVPRLLPLVPIQLALIPPEQRQADRRHDLIAGLAPHLRGQLVVAALPVPDAHLPEQRVSLEPWEAL